MRVEDKSGSSRTINCNWPLTCVSNQAMFLIKIIAVLTAVTLSWIPVTNSESSSCFCPLPCASSRSSEMASEHGNGFYNSLFNPSTNGRTGATPPPPPPTTPPPSPPPPPTTTTTTSDYCSTSTSEKLQVDEIFPEITEEQMPEFICSNESLDAAVMTADKRTYFFKGDYYWMLKGAAVVSGYPRPIGTDWDGLPGDLDAAVTVLSGRTFFFKGSQYWSFHNKKMDPGYPKAISHGFCGIPNDVDAATLWSTNGFIYFFKGDHYWRFDGGENQPTLRGPLSIGGWSGLTGPVDAALRWENGATYFMKGKYYYLYNENGLQKAVDRDGTWGLSCHHLKRMIPVRRSVL